jgi:hypothetical protein
MGVEFQFNGRRIIEPGAYSQIKSGIPSRPDVISSGNLMIVDTGNQGLQDIALHTNPYNFDYPYTGPNPLVAINWGGGAGIDGQTSSNKDSIYRFDGIDDFKAFVKGGMWYDLADYIFNPSQKSTGPQQVFYVKAATTTAGQLNFTVTAATSGVFQFLTRTEGYIANGSHLGTTDLRRGYGAKVIAGIVNPAKFILQIFVGTYAGKDILATPTGEHYNALTPTESAPKLMVQSVEFSTVEELQEWTNISIEFNRYFKLASLTGAGAITAVTGTTVAVGYNMAFSGSETYSPALLDRVLSHITEVDFSFFLADRWHTDAQSAQNTKLLTHSTNDAEFRRFVVIGAGNDALQWDNPPLATAGTGSIQTCFYYNSSYVNVVHSGIKMPRRAGFKELPSIYHAALVVGRLCGLEPQTPLTFKDLRLSAVTHELTKIERERSIQVGLIHIRFVEGMGFVINQGTNTNQVNDFLINNDGTSHEISLMRIAEQLNKELSMLAREAFVGGNLNTSSAVDIQNFTKDYLTFKTATKVTDNLIISFQDINVRLEQDAWFVTYGFVPNSPINKVFFTGFILDINISI